MRCWLLHGTFFAATLALGAPDTTAAVIDFDAINNHLLATTVASWSEEGFTVTNSFDGIPAFLVWEKTSQFNADPGGGRH